jgi:AcrR family transcriptional regulator
MARPARKPATARRRRLPTAEDSAPASAPKQTQRERLVDAMIALAAASGYQSVSVAQVSSRAGVSSATFYQQFDDKEDCFLAAYQAARKRVFEGLRPVLADGGGWSDAARFTLDGLFERVQIDPDAGRVLFVEALAGGMRIRKERERLLRWYERRLQDFLDGPSGDGEILDIPVTALEGAARSIVARHLRTHSEERLPLLVEDMLTWIGCYAMPAGAARWSTGPDALLAREQARARRPSSGRGRTRLPRGRHGLPPGVVARSQRTRIILGTAEVMMASGYAQATVTDIVAAAGIARDVFYRHFADKQSAFLAAQQYASQHLVDTCATAYFSAREWPERVWRALRTLIGLIAENPAISHLRLIECHAAGAEAIRSTDETLRAATIFLEEGYSYCPQAQELPRLCSQAIMGAVFEIVNRHVAGGKTADLPRQLPQLTYIALAPFTGREQAIRLVRELSANAVAQGVASKVE